MKESRGAIRRIIMSCLMIAVTVVVMTMSTYAAFTASATVSGINFSTGRAELKLFGNLGYTHVWNNGNLGVTQPGFKFESLGPFWTGGYRIKYFNTGTSNLMTSLKVVANSDPANLQEHVQVQVWLWADVNKNGNDGPEDSYTLISDFQPLANLVSTPVPLGQLDVHQPRGLRFKFKTDDLPSSTQNQTASFNFVIDGTTDGATQ